MASVTNTLKAAIDRNREIKPAAEYAKTKLPQPAKKKKVPESNEPKKPKAAVVLSPKDKEKAELLQSIEKMQGEMVEAAKIDNVRTFWLKDLLPGMILAEDIKGENDELLLSSGTKLNDGLIEKIKKFSEFGLCRSFLKAGSLPD